MSGDGGSRRFGSAAIFVALLGSGCATRESEHGGETNWQCVADTDCDGHRVCVARQCVAESLSHTDAGPGAVASDAGESGSAADWKMRGFDVGNTYWNRAEKKVSVTSVRKLTKAWEVEASTDGSASVNSTPVLVNGVAYLLSTSGLGAFDLATGAPRWMNPDVGGYASLAYEDHVIYAHDAKGVLHAVRDSDGTELWVNGGVKGFVTDDSSTLVGFSSPIVTKDFVIVGGSSLEEVAVPQTGPAFRGFVVAVKKDGTLGWKRYTVEGAERGATVWSTVSVDETLGRVIFGTGNNYGPPASATSDAFLAVPLATGGDFEWPPVQILSGDIWDISASGGAIASPDADIGASPILYEAGGRKLAAAGNKGGDFMIVDRTTGEMVAKRNLGPGSANRGGVYFNGAWDGAHLLAACNNATSTAPGSEAPRIDGQVSTLFALDPLTLDIVWERQLGDVVFSTITVANGVGFVGKNATLQAFDVRTGEVLFEYATEATISTSPAVSNGYVVFGSGMSWSGGSIAGDKYYALRLP
ncbi:MAG TPA: PQQ-binding-like beta-propeller repeat protein [Polyangiaceae bacterium]|nr:PQQ-binding-like beta-propeller repeat protein [Polyangiaceae bacterium]